MEMKNENLSTADRTAIRNRSKKNRNKSEVFRTADTATDSFLSTESLTKGHAFQRKKLSNFGL